MKGCTEILINQETMIDALQQYFDRQFTEGNRMTVTKVEHDKNASYGSADNFKASLKERDAAQVA